ncbi:SusC/RagA family TonB-linked outer membrane protein [Segatella bryantii]|uniref:SusC/RagA family protein n=1 Tax=Segatella bryantii TaxID=77095 RepID=A0ABX4EIF4_SEGBR|nr:TonB-dependent receptor [Segatella bryantii]OYP55914.1 SusC/RagA family protein [Segatella bryantii]UKK81143.1 TonB-dependent receptor [Segatella bryantii]
MKQVNFKLPLRSFAIASGIFLSATALAQSNTAKGQVKDATGEPVIGATIMANGKAVGVTDFDGNYSVNVPKGTELTITYVGMTPMKVKAGENQVITLTADDKTLNEVVVIGYGAVKKSDLTGSVSALKPDGKNKGVVVNAQDMLAGKVAGVSVTSNDGTPGGATTMRIRGGSSLNASNDPLIVIDNVPIDNNGVKGLSNILSAINPQDIESFNILKDASATAIYGSRGSNGVIIITTKKGHKGGVKVSYNGSMTISMKKKTVDVLNGDEFRALIKEKWGENSDAYNALGTANTDWQDLIYRTAISQDHGVTISGSAGAYLPYRVSLGYTDQQGILKTSDFKRYTASFNLNPSLLDNHLNINLNAKGMYAHSKYADTDAISAAVNMDPTQDPYSYTSNYHKTTYGDNLTGLLNNFNGFFAWPKSGNYGDPTWPYTYNELATKNPLSVLSEKNDRANSREFIGSADFDYKVHGFEDLRLHATLGADIAKGKQTTDYSPSFQNNNNAYYGNYGWESILKRNLSLSTYAQYFHDFNDKAKNHFDIMAGYEWQHFWSSTRNNYWGYYGINSTLTDTKGNSRAGQKYNESNYATKTENYLVSFFGRANWSLMDRYYVTATVRDDGSSRFKDHWAVFPSFAFAWKINEENKFKEIKWLSDLKLRLGWGKTGQQDVKNDYAWIPTYTINTGTGAYYYADGDGVLYRPDNYTPKLKWETTTTYNLGLDWGINNQRLSGTIDWYYRETTDLLNYAPTKALSAFRNQAWQNIGSMKNTGVEAAISWKAIQSKDWYWTIDANFTYNANTITDLSGTSSDGSPVANTDIKIGTDKYLEYNQVGHPMNSFWVFQQAYDENGKAIENAVVDRNGDGQITNDDRYFYKSPAAPITVGLSSRLEYKNWDFSFSMRGNIGNYVYDAVSQGFHNVSANALWASTNFLINKTSDAVLDNWQTDDVSAILSDRWIHNASFLKMENITLGYTFDKLFKSGNWHGVSGRVYATASNVFTITKYDGLDPEVYNGYDNNIYPRPFSVIVGLNLNF